MAQSDSSLTSKPAEPTTDGTYKLSCNHCSFETTVEGDCFDALEVADAHQEEYTEHLAAHSVDFTLTDS